MAPARWTRTVLAVAVLPLAAAVSLRAEAQEAPAPPVEASPAPAPSAPPSPGAVPVAPQAPVHTHANARCRDSAILPRLPGCVIRECVERDYDEAELQAGPMDASGEYPRKLVEGQMSVLTYVCPAELSLEEIARRTQATVRRGGYGMVYAGSMFYNELPGFTARKGRWWVQLVSEPLDERTGYTVTMVKAVVEEPVPRVRPATRRGRKTT